MSFYVTPKQDDFNKIPELQVCIAEALYDVDSIVADPGAYTKRRTGDLTPSDCVESRMGVGDYGWECGSIKLG